MAEVDAHAELLDRPPALDGAPSDQAASDTTQSIMSPSDSLSPISRMLRSKALDKQVQGQREGPISMAPPAFQRRRPSSTTMPVPVPTATRVVTPAALDAGCSAPSRCTRAKQPSRESKKESPIDALLTRQHEQLAEHVREKRRRQVCKDYQLPEQVEAAEERAGDATTEASSAQGPTVAAISGDRSPPTEPRSSGGRSQRDLGRRQLSVENALDCLSQTGDITTTSGAPALSRLEME